MMIWPKEPETETKYSSMKSSLVPEATSFWPSSSARMWIFRPLSSVARPLKWISASVRVSSADVSVASSVPPTFCSSLRMPPMTTSDEPFTVMLGFIIFLSAATAPPATSIAAATRAVPESKCFFIPTSPWSVHTWFRETPVG